MFLPPRFELKNGCHDTAQAIVYTGAMSPDYLAQLITDYRYWIIIPLSIFEGPVVAFIVGTLSSLGYFNPYIAMCIFFTKDMVMDGTFYFLGRYAKQTAFVHRILKKGGFLTESTESFKEVWELHGFRTMFLVKLPHGFSSAFLVMSGFVEAPIRRFFVYAAVIALAQYAIVLVLGYYFGSFFATEPDLFTRIQYIFTGTLFVGAAYFVLLWYVRHKFRKQRQTSENHP
ncbi:MAG TPA: hypothetical protein VKA94_13655 [Hyphomicrobiales bacterium]|nr:hypothetical protein [Hyphomicrobiales bacterium]